MEIRRLDDHDADTWLAVRLRALRDHPEDFYASVEDEATLPMEEVKERLARDPRQAFVLGAFPDGELVGTAGMFRERFGKAHHKAVVWGMYVAPRARRRGIGRKLMVELVARARAAGVERLQLSVSAGNRAARALYIELGFEPWGMEPDSFRVDGRSIDEEHLALRLNQEQGTRDKGRGSGTVSG
ncbi:MAG TPA: GNAT family N-acetyltransferase [Polyangiaceae bacterium]|nr:GNAT family N-acetyltransferase [Polyangiaceae bacterium]